MKKPELLSLKQDGRVLTVFLRDTWNSWRICQQRPFQMSHKHLSGVFYQESWLWARRWALGTSWSCCQPTLSELH